MIRSEIRTEVQRLLNDTAGIRYTTATINDWIALGVVDVSAELGLDTAMATISTIGSDAFASSEPNYQLPTTTLNIREVYLQDANNNEQRLRVYDQDELNELVGPGWRATTEVGVPAWAYRADYNVLGLHPRPNATHNGKTLRVFYDRIPADLASDSDTPTFFNAIHDALTMYSVSRGYDLLGDIKRSQYYLSRYHGLIKRFKSKQLQFSDDMRAFRWE